MPTGYTAEILDGKVKSFPEFAKLCMRAFGATIHMRDDDMDKEYEPRVPSDCPFKALESAKKELNKAESLKDDEIIAMRKKTLTDDRKYALKSIKEKQANLVKLNNILSQINLYIPPTPDHVGIKEFMINQITETIKWDCNMKHNEETLARVEKELIPLRLEKK